MSSINDPVTHIPKFQIDSIPEEFWAIVELARQDFERCHEMIESLDRRSLIRFYWNYLLIQANFLWEPYRIEDYSDGLNDDIGHWIVAQGKEYYSKVIADPKSVPRLEYLGENFDLEPRLIEPILDIYEKDYNRDIPPLDEYKDEFWNLIDLGTESLDKLVETVKTLSREALLEFIQAYEKAINQFEKRFVRSLSDRDIDIKSLNYTVRDISQWVVAQGREDFCDYEYNIARDDHVPVDLSDPRMLILDRVARECEKRYYNYPSQEFWDIIALAQHDFSQFGKQAEQMSRDQLMGFSQDLEEVGIPLFQALATSQYYQSPEFSRFELDVICKWIVARGRGYYAKMISRPHLIPQLRIDSSDPDIAVIFDVIDTIFDGYFERYNEPIP